MDPLARWARTAGRWAWRHFRLLAGIGLLVGLTLTLAANRDAIAAAEWSIDPFTLAAAIALLAVAPLAQALTLRIARRRLGAGAPGVATLRIWARSFLLRYEPSGAVGFVYRVRERDRPGAAALLALALRVVSFGAELLAVAVAELTALVWARRARNTPAKVRNPAAAASSGAFRGLTPPNAPLEPARTTRTIVVVPTYDERESLPLFLERFAPTGMDLLIVDDNSPDGTGELADELAATRPWMHVLHRAEKDGLGMAYRAGFAWCLGRDYDVIGQMDCDLSHPPEKLAEMRAVLLERDAGLVLGSRYEPGGGTDGWSPTRLAMSRVGCSASRLALGLPFSDLSGGFKLWRASCLAAIDLDELLSAGYAFQVETTQLAHLAGTRIEEVPFVFSERVAGASKMTLRISLEGIRVTLALRRHHRPVRRHGLLGAL